MFRLLPKLFKNISKSVQVKKISIPMMSYQFSSSEQNNKKQKQVYYEDIVSDHKYNQKVMELQKMNESEQIQFLDTIIKKYNADAVEICDYGNIIIDAFIANQDFTNALRCCEIVTSYLKNKVSDKVLYLFSFYTIMVDCCLKLENRTKAAEYIQEAEQVYSANHDVLVKDKDNHFSHTHMLALRFSDIGYLERCVFYSSVALSIEEISLQHKVFPTLLLIDSLGELQRAPEGLEFGIKFLAQVSFEEIGLKFDETQLEMLKQIYERVATILIQQDELKDAYLYQDILLYLILITESETSFKYEAVYNWRQEILYQLVLQEKGDLKELFQKCELEKSKKLGILTKQMENDAQERAVKLQKSIQNQYDQLKEILSIHKEVYEISEKRFDADNLLTEDIQQQLLNLVKKSVEIEEKLLNVPLIDQYFVKEQYYKVKSKVSKETQEKIEKQLSKKK